MAATAAAGIGWWAYDAYPQLAARNCRPCLYAIVLVPALAVVLAVAAVRRDANAVIWGAGPLAILGLCLVAWRAADGPAACGPVGECAQTASRWVYVAVAGVHVAVLGLASWQVVNHRRP